MGANAASVFAPTRDHAATEELLKASGVPFTSLRNGFYAETILFLLGSVKETGTIVTPADGPVSWTARPDLAEAAVIALTEPSRLSGISPPLTSAQALDFTQIASLASEILGRPITHSILPDEEYKELRRSQGMPEFALQMMGGPFAASRKGEFAVVDPTLQSLLGRPPISVRDLLETHFSR